jgi:hypothetical protein
VFSYRGKFELVAPGGSIAEQGACEVQFDDEKFSLTPESGLPLVFDLGDVDTLAAADHEARLAINGGDTIKLRQFGRSFDELTIALQENHRKRTLECLLLEDLDEIDRFNGTFTLEPAAGPASSGSVAAALTGSIATALSGSVAPARSGAAEIRLFRSNLAVLPGATQAFQWRFADIAQVRFDAQSYELILEGGGGRLRLGRLGRRSEELQNKLREALNALSAETGRALQATLPFLNAMQLRTVAKQMPEGSSASLAELAKIHPRIPEAFTANAVDPALRPYYDELVQRTVPGSLFAGFKLIRPESADVSAAMDEEAIEHAQPGQQTQPGQQRLADQQAEARERLDAQQQAAARKEAQTQLARPEKEALQILYWFFFPIRSGGDAGTKNAVAWEASSASGRATYLFRLAEPGQLVRLQDPATAAATVAQSIARITRVLGLISFRRLPIYISEDVLSTDPAYQRYAIAARKIPEVREVRAALLGRAIHTTPEAWKEKLDAILG